MWKSVHSISSKSIVSSQGQDLEVHFYLLKRLRKPPPTKYTHNCQTIFKHNLVEYPRLFTAPRKYYCNKPDYDECFKKQIAVLPVTSYLQDIDSCEQNFKTLSYYSLQGNETL